MNQHAGFPSLSPSSTSILPSPSVAPLPRWSQRAAASSGQSAPGPSGKSSQPVTAQRFSFGLGWVVRFDKGDFRGRAALEAERDRGIVRRLRGLGVEGRQPPRAGCRVLLGDAVVGEVTSGNFSPCLGHGIALAFLPTGLEDGAGVTVEIRGRRVPATVVRPPFI